MSKYTVKEGQTNFDVVNATYGNLNYTYQLLIENNIPELSVVPVNQEVEYVPPQVTPPTIDSRKPTDAITEEIYSSKNNQSVYDVCLQTYGNLNVLYKLLQDSNFANLLTSPLPGTLFTFNPQLVEDQIFADYLKKNKLIITTGSSQGAVFGKEDLTTIFISEDGQFEFTLES